MDFATKLKEIREKNFSDLEIAEELTKICGLPVSRQVVYNYRTAKRPNPAVFEVAVAILKLHKRIVEDKNDNTPNPKSAISTSTTTKPA